MKIKEEKIRQTRIQKGFSQEYVAEMLGISQAQYNRLENGKNHFDIEKLGQLFDILELNPLEALQFSEKQQVFINSSNSGNINSNFNNNDSEFIRKIVQEELSKKQ